MKVIFMGTPEFAVPALQKIIDSKHEVLFVITQPDKKVGRKQVITPPPVKVLAQENNIDVCQPEKLNKDLDLIEKIKGSAADVMITVAYGQIIKQEILDVAPIINVHASLLPKYRGPAPINWSLINGDKEVGVTTMLTAKGVDTGDMLLKASFEIDDYKDSIALTKELSELGAELLIKTLDDFENISPEKQKDLDEAHEQYSPFMNKDLGEIDFSKKELILKSANPRQDYFLNKKLNSAKNIHNLVRALKPWPGAYFIFKEQKILLLETDFNESKIDAMPGEIVEINKIEQSISVATQEGILEIKKLKAQGKSEIQASAWLNGVRLNIGEKII
jgi:methionyl-tRNA formyltransferase